MHNGETYDNGSNYMDQNVKNTEIYKVHETDMIFHHVFGNNCSGKDKDDCVGDERNHLPNVMHRLLNLGTDGCSVSRQVQRQKHDRKN